MGKKKQARLEEERRQAEESRGATARITIAGYLRDIAARLESGDICDGTFESETPIETFCVGSQSYPRYTGMRTIKLTFPDKTLFDKPKPWQAG